MGQRGYMLTRAAYPKTRARLVSTIGIWQLGKQAKELLHVVFADARTLRL